MYYILNSISLYFILGTGLSLCLLEIRWLHKQFAWQKASRFVKILWSNMAKQQRMRNNHYAKENCREILILVLSEVTCSCSTEHCPPERSAQVLHGATHKLITTAWSQGKQLCQPAALMGLHSFCAGPRSFKLCRALCTLLLYQHWCTPKYLLAGSALCCSELLVQFVLSDNSSGQGLWDYAGSCFATLAP